MNMNNSFYLNGKEWEYVTLSRISKYYGGPEKFVNYVYNKGKIEGRYDTMVMLLKFLSISLPVFFDLLKEFQPLLNRKEETNEQE